MLTRFDFFVIKVTHDDFPENFWVSSTYPCQRVSQSVGQSVIVSDFDYESCTIKGPLVKGKVTMKVVLHLKGPLVKMTMIESCTIKGPLVKMTNSH